MKTETLFLIIAWSLSCGLLAYIAIKVLLLFSTGPKCQKCKSLLIRVTCDDSIVKRTCVECGEIQR